MGPLPKSYGENEHLLVIVDNYSKWTEVFPLKRATGSEVAAVLVRQIFCRFGAPRKLLSDNGTQFTGKDVAAVCENWGAQQIFTTPYHPQTNWVEQQNKVLKSMIRAFVNNDHKTWDIHISEFAFAINTARHETTGLTPGQMMFKRGLRTPIN